MLRKEITEGFQAVHGAIEESRVLEMLKDPGREGASQKKGKPQLDLVESFRKWTRASDKFSPAARAVMEVLEFDFLEDNDFWEVILGRQAGPGVVPTEFLLKVSFFVLQMPKVIALLKRDVDQYAVGEARPAEAKHDVLSVTVLEEKAYSSPARISELMSSIQLLYEACAELEDVSASDLSLISCDAGSDKSFDFLGVAKLIEQVRKIILDLWDRVVFYRERKLSTHLELLSNSLPLIEQITSLEQSKKLGPEQAEKLRRNVVEGVGKFLKAGAVIPEMEKVSSFPPRQLMAPEPKLLVSPVDDPLPEPKEGKLSEGQNGSPRPGDPELRDYVERVAKEVLKRDKSEWTQKHTDKDPEASESGPQQTDPGDEE